MIHRGEGVYQHFPSSKGNLVNHTKLYTKACKQARAYANTLVQTHTHTQPYFILEVLLKGRDREASSINVQCI